MNKFFKINELDNVAVALEDINKGFTENGLTAVDDIPFGHKILLNDAKAGDNIIKYGYPIGHLTKDVKAGGYIHSHNLKTNLSNKLNYAFSNDNVYLQEKSDKTFLGYRTKSGKAATRNEIWIIPTVGCVNKTAEKLEQLSNSIIGDGCDGVFAFTHPFGCSQLGDDEENTRKILASLINHSNAAGVLVVSLGCENSNVDVIKTYLPSIDNDRIKFLVTQDVDNELEHGIKLIKQLYNNIKDNKREPINISELVVGYKCGGSDAFSGITANALCGRLTDKLTSFGASAVLTEVPEMFGAETILMNRCKNEKIFNKTVSIINNFKDYFISHNQKVCENPSPGNKAGGITTLEEKSLGCIQKGGNAVINDVLLYGEQIKSKGLSLLTGPGNDIVSVTNLTAAGAMVILFTTGRGTPLGAPAPTIKISSNSHLAKKKPSWIDFDSGQLIENSDFDSRCNDLLSFLIETASGKKTKSEQNGYRQISIFKDGVVL